MMRDVLNTRYICNISPRKKKPCCHFQCIMQRVRQICNILFGEGATIRTISFRSFLTGNNNNPVVLIIDLDQLLCSVHFKTGGHVRLCFQMCSWYSKHYTWYFLNSLKDLYYKSQTFVVRQFLFLPGLSE
jgi:hypothetical protein